MATAEILTLFPYDFKVAESDILILEQAAMSNVFSFVSGDLPQGVYTVSLSFVANFTTAGDTVKWNVTGTVATQTFDFGDGILGPAPFVFSFPLVHLGGVISANLNMQVAGTGLADVLLTFASISVKKERDLP